MSDEIRGASKITDQEFLVAYNDTTKDNLAVITALRTDWTAVGVKLRSPRVVLHTTVERTGGKGGTFAARPAPLALEAQIWVRYGTIQQQPANGSYVPLAERIRSGEVAIDGDLNLTTTAPAAATETAAAPLATAAPASTGSQPPVAGFSFEAEIFSAPYQLSGPTKDDALHALFVKLQDLNFSKVMITNRATGSVVGINDIQNGGRYKLAKQLTAA